MSIHEAGVEDVAELTEFLRRADLTTAGLGAALRVWIERDESGAIVGSTGFERVGAHALIRSVAVDAAHRASGRGSALAQFALAEAMAEGARTAWLFSRRSGPFWSSLGFEPADRDELVRVLASTQQVQMFAATGQLEREVAWSRPMPHTDTDPEPWSRA